MSWIRLAWARFKKENQTQKCTTPIVSIGCKISLLFQVYIVAMVSNGSAPGSYIKQLDSKPINNQAELAKWRNQLLQNTNQIDNASFENSPEEEYGEFESKGESLLKLVAPELDSLGANWLAALRDHALLSLPPGMGFLVKIMLFNYVLPI